MAIQASPVYEKVGDPLSHIDPDILLRLQADAISRPETTLNPANELFPTFQRWFDLWRLSPPHDVDDEAPDRRQKAHSIRDKCKFEPGDIHQNALAEQAIAGDEAVLLVIEHDMPSRRSKPAFGQWLWQIPNLREDVGHCTGGVSKMPGNMAGRTSQRLRLDMNARIKRVSRHQQ